MDKEATVKLHPVVELLVARAKSHPEEFNEGEPNGCRWSRAITAINESANEENRTALNKEINLIELNNAHKWAMDELLNGDERRRVYEEEVEKNRKAYGSLGGSMGSGNAALTQSYNTLMAQQQQQQAKHQISQLELAKLELETKKMELQAGSMDLYSSSTYSPHNTGLLGTLKKWF